VLGSESSTSFSLSGAKVPGDESSIIPNHLSYRIVSYWLADWERRRLVRMESRAVTFETSTAGEAVPTQRRVWSGSRDPRSPPVIRQDFATSPWKRFRPSTADVEQPRPPSIQTSTNFRTDTDSTTKSSSTAVCTERSCAKRLWTFIGKLVTLIFAVKTRLNMFQLFSNVCERFPRKKRVISVLGRLLDWFDLIIKSVLRGEGRWGEERGREGIYRA